jgi:hypothetical protein
MSQRDSEFWIRARRARDKLVDQFIHHPDVSLVDIGHATEHDAGTQEVVLRIHVREHWAEANPKDRATFPEQVDNVPVIVMLGDYQLETHAPAADQACNPSS